MLLGSIRNYNIRRRFIQLQRKGLSVRDITQALSFRYYLTPRTIMNIVYEKKDEPPFENGQLSLFPIERIDV